MELKALADKIGFEEDEYRELIELFLETSRSDLKAMKKAFDDQNFEKMAETAHSIKGASGNMGLQEIYELSRSIEMEARGKLLDTTNGCIAAIDKELEKLSILLNR